MEKKRAVELEDYDLAMEKKVSVCTNDTLNGNCINSITLN